MSFLLRVAREPFRLLRSSLVCSSLSPAPFRCYAHHHSIFGSPVILPEESSLIQVSPYEDVSLPVVSYTDYVWEKISLYKEKEALVCGMTGRSYTYEMMQALSIKFGSALIRSGARKGDVLGLVLPNIPEFVISFMGAAAVGVTLTTMNPTYRPEEIARQLENSGAKYVMTIGLFLPNMKQACEIYKGIEKIIVIGMEDTPSDCTSFMQMAIFDDGSYFDKREKIDPETDILAMPYSSGTTGPPKGVALTHSCMVANIAQISHPKILVFQDDADYQPTSIAVLPFFHIFAMTCSMSGGLRCGARLITLPKFEPDMFINSLVQYKPDHLMVVPPLVSFMTSSPLIKPSHLNCVKVITGGASTFGNTMINKFMSKCPGGVRFQEGYGMTECSPVTHVQPKDGVVYGSCGNLVPNTVAKIVDIDSRKTLGPGETGELCVAGPQIMKGYHKNKKATDKIIKDGWLLTGDIAYYNEDGHFFIVDRLKELIKVKGLQVAPSELEDLIRNFPGVDDVAVVGVPDERCGELPRAYVVRKNRGVLEQDIIDFVTEKVAPHKKLGAGVMFVDTLPKNQTGKILRRELKAQVFKGSFGY